MENDNASPSCIIYLSVVLGIALAIGVALLMSQLDALQQRALLPQATLPVIDLEATLSAGDLTVVVIEGAATEGLQSNEPPATPTLIPKEENREGMASEEIPEPTFTPAILPTCAALPDDWVPYNVKAHDSLRSLAIRLGIDEDALAHANCLVQPHLKQGQLIYLPSSPEK